MNGQATYREDLPLVMNRKGFDEQTWFTFSYSPVRDETGSVAGMFCACTETTEKVLGAEQLREADRRKDEFLAMLAHELRNPLAPIRTGLELIRVAGNTPEAVEPRAQHDGAPGRAHGAADRRSARRLAHHVREDPAAARADAAASPC